MVMPKTDSQIVKTPTLTVDNDGRTSRPHVDTQPLFADRGLTNLRSTLNQFFCFSILLRPNGRGKGCRLTPPLYLEI